ncbi:MAG: hypothetical protein ACRDFW_06365 [bacterium]
MKRTMYKVHKGFAVTVGAFILVWLISGMILPPLSRGPASQQKSASVDFREITMSPAAAIAAVTKIRWCTKSA